MFTRCLVRFLCCSRRIYFFSRVFRLQRAAPAGPGPAKPWRLGPAELGRSLPRRGGGRETRERELGCVVERDVHSA